MEQALTLKQFEQFMNAFRQSLKEDFATKNDMADLKSSFSDVQESVDRNLKFTEA